MYSKYASTKIELNETAHLLLKEDEIIDDVKDINPLNDRVLIAESRGNP